MTMTNVSLVVVVVLRILVAFFVASQCLVVAVVAAQKEAADLVVVVVDPLGRGASSLLLEPTTATTRVHAVQTLHQAAALLAAQRSSSSTPCRQRRRVLLAADVPHVLSEPLELDDRHSCSVWQAVGSSNDNDNDDDDNSLDKTQVHIQGGVRIPVEYFQEFHLDGSSSSNNNNSYSHTKHRYKVWVAQLDQVDPTLDLGEIMTPNSDPLGGRCNHRKTAHVYWNGKPMTLARHPNIHRRGGDDQHDIWQWFNFPNITASNTFLRDKRDHFRKMLYNFRQAGGQDDNDIWFHGYWGFDWADDFLKAANIDWNSYTFDNVTTPSSYDLKPEGRYSIVNSLAALDAPGEYYLDRKHRLLYVIAPTAGVFGIDAEIVITTTETLLEVTNATDIDLQHLHWSYSRGTAVQLSNVTKVRLMHGSVQNVGGDWAVAMAQGKDSKIQNMHVKYLQCGGISVHAGNRSTLEPGNTAVENCVIEHTSLWKRTYMPAIYFLGVGLTMSGNRIGHAPHTGVSGHGNDCLFEDNHLHDLCFETTDVGAFYVGRSWADRGNVWRHNVFERIRRTELNATLGYLDVIAIYLDDLMSGYHFHNTTIIDCDTGILLGGGRDNVFTDTTMIRVDVPLSFDKRGHNWSSELCQPKGMLESELRSFDYRRGAWALHYPDLMNIMKENPCTPMHNRISDFTFCHDMQNETFWAKTPDSDIAELLLWDNRFSNIRQKMQFCNSSRSELGEASEENFFDPGPLKPFPVL